MMIDGESVETEGIACIVTNLNELGAYSQRLNLNVDPGDGLLDLFILKDVGSAVVAAAQIVQSGDEESANLQHWQGKAITIETDPIQDYSLDGDPLSQTPLEIQVLPQAVTVLVPTPAEEA
jgi:diacylglycerol kinase family enzyme